MSDKPKPRGGPRPDSGRDTIFPDNPTRGRNVSLRESDWEFLARIGNGNTSRGIRRLIELVHIALNTE